jgi:cytoskeletal protein CcmA (bactofilin family)
MEDQDTKERKLQPQVEYPEKASRLGPQIFLKGDINGADHLIVEGKVQGTIDLKGKTVIIEKTACVEAQVSGHNIFISGEVIGNVSASGKVVIFSTGRITGDISASKISVADGSQFKGKIKIQAPGA